MRTSVLIPAFNEEETLAAVVRESGRFSSLQVVVDDGSTDGSGAQLKGLQEEIPTLSVVRHPGNLGMAAAIKSGFFKIVHLMDDGKLHADDAVVLLDADGQHRPADIPSLVDRLFQAGTDLEIGRRDFTVYPLYKKLGNKALSLWGRLLTGFAFNDIECGFKALRAGAVPLILEYYTGHRYSCAQEIAVIAVLRGLKAGNDCKVPVPLYSRGARIRDVLPVLALSLRACLRVRLGRARDFRRHPLFTGIRNQ